MSKLSSPIWINFATFQSYFYLVSTKIFICEITKVNLYSWQHDHYLQISIGAPCLKVIDSKAAPCPQLSIKSSSSWNAERWSEPSSQNTQVQQPLDQIVNLTLLGRWMMTLLLFYICFFFQQLQSFSDHHVPGHLCDLPIHNVSHHFWASPNQLWIWKQKCGQICVKLGNQRTIGLTTSWLWLIDVSTANLLHFLALDRKGVIFKKNIYL